MQKIKSGDNVILIAGKDRGRQGKVLRLIQRKAKKGCRTEGLKIVVEGLNLIKRHVRGNPSQEKTGGIISKEAPMHISNVAIFNSATSKADRVGFKTLEDGRKVRIFKSSGEVIDG